MPAFAVVIKANSAAIEMMMNPGVPVMILAASAIGVSEPEKSFAGKTPTVTIRIRVYIIVTVTTEKIMPRGIFFLGFLISSETLATFNNPPKEMKIKPAVAKIGLIPLGVKG